MSGRVSRADNDAARAIWSEVEKAAQHCPEWVRPHVSRAAEVWVESVQQKGVIGMHSWLETVRMTVVKELRNRWFLSAGQPSEALADSIAADVVEDLKELQEVIDAALPLIHRTKDIAIAAARVWKGSAVTEHNAELAASDAKAWIALAEALEGKLPHA